MKKIKAVIFDMDGVLIDSEPVYLNHQYEQLKEKYPWLKRESLYPVVGMSSQDYMPFMAKLCRRENDSQFRQELESLNAKCRIFYPDILRKEVPMVLETLKQMGMKLALASSSSEKNIHQVLNECGIMSYFSVIVSGGQFTQSKPDPEIYLHTMEKLGCEPEECLIVEDSTYGICAGTAAGGVVAALRDERFPFDQSKANIHLHSLAEVPRTVINGGKKVKAAFFDIDGTLITSGTHELPQSAAAAIDALKKKGIFVLLSTGRHRLEIEEENLLPDLEFDGAVYMNGQLCELHGKEILENPISFAELKELRLFLQEKKRSCIFLEKDSMYANFVDERMIEGQKIVGTAVPPIRDISDLENRTIYQVIPFVSSQEEEELMRVMPNCQTKRWGDAVVDLMSKKGGKENGIRAVCDALNISMEETIAFGDGANDMEMLECAGIGVAMGNSSDLVCGCADFVTDTVEGDGIANALYRLHIIEKQ